MLNRLIRWLASAEIDAARNQRDTQLADAADRYGCVIVTADRFGDIALPLYHAMPWQEGEAIGRLTQRLHEAERASAELQQVAYANGFNAGRATGHGEMLAHLRGDLTERPTTEMIQRRAIEMVH